MTTDDGTSIPLARVVAVVATLPGGKEQVGSGYLVSDQVVLTAAHCTRNKTTGAPAVRLRVLRALDGLGTDQLELLRSPAMDVAVLRLTNPPWTGDLPAPAFARVDRSRSGVLRDCVCIGYPLFQYDPGSHDRRTAELHGVIYQSDEAETGRLLMREPLLSSSSVGSTGPDTDERSRVWGGLSGAVVFHHGRALGVVVEHHPRQGNSAVQLVAFDRLASATDADTRAVTTALSLPVADLLPWATGEPVRPLPELVDVLAGEDLPSMRDLDPYRLGATASDYGNERTFGQADPYVPRTHRQVDDRLDQALDPGTLALLVGPSKAGKTRTAFEAARRRWPDAQVLVPTPGQLGTLTAHPRLQATSDLMLIWLDDLQRFVAGTDPLTPGTLSRLFARPGPTVVLATLRQEARDRLRDTTGELARDARAVLDSALTVELEHTSADPAEQAAAQAAYPNADLDGAGLAEELAHAPALLAAYQATAESDPLQHHLVRVAIDWARTGLQRPISEPELIQLARDALWMARPDLEPTDHEAAQAAAAARKPLPGTGRAALLLTYPLPDRVRGYRAFSYLLAADDGQTGQPRPIPDRFWGQVLQRATLGEAHDIGTAAYYRGTPRASLPALEMAADGGNLEARRQIGYLLAYEIEPPDLVGACAAFAQAAAADHTPALYSLGILLSDRLDPPDLPAARAAFARAAAAGHAGAAYNLGVLLGTRLDPPDLPGARNAFEQAAAAGDADAAFNLGVLLAAKLDPPDLPAARAAFEQAAAAGNTNAAVNLGVLLSTQLDPPDLPAARAAFEQAAATGDTDALVNLGVLLSTRLDPPDLPAARAAYEQAADGGNADALVNLGFLHAQVGAEGAARESWQKAVDSTDEEAVAVAAVNLAPLVALSGDITRARCLLLAAHDAGAESAATYAAAIDADLATREAAIRKLSDGPPDTDALNVRGVAAWVFADHREARLLWESSQAAGDAVAPLLLTLTNGALAAP